MPDYGLCQNDIGLQRLSFSASCAVSCGSTSLLSLKLKCVPI